MSINDELKKKKNELEKVEKENEELLRIFESVSKEKGEKLEEER